jgi:hypothetical protein
LWTLVSITLMNVRLNWRLNQLLLTPEENKPTSYGLVVVRCNEEISWLREVPSSIQITLYEKCGQRWDGTSSVSSNMNMNMNMNMNTTSQPLVNLGREEASGYLQYIVDNYENLPDILWLLQSDVFGGQKYGNPKRQFLGHSSLQNVSDLLQVTEDYMATGYLRYGRYRHRAVEWREAESPTDRLFKMTTSVHTPHDPYSYIRDRNLLLEIVQLIGFSADANTKLDFSPGACMAVSKERILRHPRPIYEKLLTQIRTSLPGDARRYACALERTWHVIFGSPPLHTYQELYPRPY